MKARLLPRLLYKMTCYHILYKKNSFYFRSACLHSFCSLNQVYILYPVCSLHFVYVLTDFWTSLNSPFLQHVPAISLPAGIYRKFTAHRTHQLSVVVGHHLHLQLGQGGRRSFHRACYFLKVTAYSFTTARVLMAKTLANWANSKEKVSVFRNFMMSTWPQKAKLTVNCLAFSVWKISQKKIQENRK